MAEAPPARRGSRFTSQLIGFSLPILLASLAPLLAISIISRVGGVEGWYPILVGQAIGALASLVVVWGWEVVGPSRVAADPDKADSLLMLSLGSRGLLLLVVGPVSAIITFLLLVEVNPVVGVLACLSSAIQGVSLNWWFVATRRPGGIIRFDAVPRLLAVLTSSALIVLTNGNSWLYPALTLLAAATAYVVGYARWGRGIPASSARESLASLRPDARVASIGIAGATYGLTAVPLVELLAPAIGPAYASANRVYSYWTFATIVSGNTFQGWVNAGGVKGVVRRARRALAWFIAQGIVLGLALAVLGPAVARFVFADSAMIPDAAFISLGASFAFVSVSTVLGRLLLIPLGHQPAVMIATVGMSVTAIVSVPAAAALFGLTAGFATLAAIEALFAIALGAIVVRVRGREGQDVIPELPPPPIDGLDLPRAEDPEP